MQSATPEPSENLVQEIGMPGADAPKPKPAKPKPQPKKTVTKRSGKAIGARAAKAKAAETVRPKGAESGFTDSQRIHRLKTAKERGGSDAKQAQFRLYREGMTISEFVKRGGRLPHLRRDIKYGHISVTQK